MSNSKESDEGVENDGISQEFLANLPKYRHLASNLASALTLLLEENDIKFLSISSRVKDIESFLEKIERKGYEEPLDEIHDICGVRVICYYAEDLEKIGKIIKKEFQIHESVDKEDLLKPNQFGYRSHHFIVSVKKEWLKTPNYKTVGDLKAEIQVRIVSN